MVAWFYGSRRAMVQIIFKVIDNTMISLSYPTPDLLGAMLMSNFTVIVQTIFSARWELSVNIFYCCFFVVGAVISHASPRFYEVASCFCRDIFSESKTMQQQIPLMK